MVSISPAPLSQAMMQHLNMDELRFLEAKNAQETQRLLRKQKSATPRTSSELSISPAPLSQAMMQHLNMDELRFLEAKNAQETQRLLRKQKSATPRISSERLKQLRRAVISHSKKMSTKASHAQARGSSEKRAKREAQRRKTAYEKKSAARRKGYDSMWYNQVPSFYRGSSSLRRRRGKRSPRSPRRRRRSMRR